MFETCKYCDSAIRVLNKTYDLVECDNCSLIFSRKIYTQEELQTIYNQLYNKINPQYKYHSITEFEQLKKGKVEIGFNKKRFIKKFIKNSSKVLEIGSGVGVIGCYIRQNFPTAFYTGVEIDAVTNQKAKSLGLNVHHGDFSIIEDFSDKYDVILMWEVLEHIQNLKVCISLIEKKLTHDGVFIFSVPNYDKRFNYKNPGDKLYTSPPPIHLNFFREKSIHKIFNSKKFEIKTIRKKKIPYLNTRSLKQMFLKIITGNFEGPTIYSVIRKK